MKSLRKGILKVLIISMTIILVMGNSITYANKVFSDVPSNHWAIGDINKMNNLGIITGMTDGTFKPNLDVPVSQAVVMMVRIMQPARADITTAMNLYRGVITEVGVETWAQEQMAYALLKGIISERELRSSYVNGSARAAEKLEIVRYLTRALGLEEEANNKQLIVLDFKDTDKIPNEDRAYVSMMVDIGVINPYGDVVGNFNPKDPMTRAMMAKVLSVAYDYNQEKKQAEFAKYNKDITGTIEEIKYGDTPSIKVKDATNNLHEHSLKNPVRITRGTTNLSLIDLKIGDRVDVKVVEDLVTTINIKDVATTTPKEENVEGVITSIVITNRVEINIRDNAGADKAYRIAPHVITLLDQKSNKSIMDLRAGYSVKLNIVNGEVIVIFAETKDVAASDRYTGIVEFVDKDQKGFIIRPEGQNVMRIDTTATTTYINVLSNDSTFNAVAINRKVTVMGEYVNGRFVANTVVITE